MLRRACRGFLLVAPAAGLLAAPAPARAAEGYVCGPDTIVYVEANELEHKKRTDPCIAGYFGLKIEPPAAAPAPPARPVANSPAKTIAEPSAKPAEPARIVAAPRPPAPVPAKTIAAPQPRAERVAALAPKPAPETDFRNVRILNAKSAQAAWYRHNR
ncbi:MAG: hypothetical protein ACT4OU_13205 [Hyphomicrobium sp.]